MNKKTIINTISGIDNWFLKNNYKGYDIYDLYDTRFFHWLITDKPIIIRKINRRIISWLIKLFPSVIIRIFKIKRNINAKAMGLLLKGYCNLYTINENHEYLCRAKEVANWLINNTSKEYSGYCWGYPFDWSGSKFIPKNTPSSVVTATIDDGFYSLYKITKNNKYLEICVSICNFFLTDLNIDTILPTKICFSYTPIDNDHVHNANLFTSEFLIRIGLEVNNRDYIDFGKKAVNYSLGEQEVDGSLKYWGRKDSKHMKFTKSSLDHYHSGFEIRTIWRISQLLEDNRIYASYKNYYDFYKKNYIGKGFLYLRPLKKYPINIHACSEFIICNSIIEKGIYTKEKWFDEISDWINRKMLDKDGLYILEINRMFCFPFKSKFKYHRWSQAWMFLALTEYLVSVKRWRD